jgi:hypothetical protein
MREEFNNNLLNNENGQVNEELSFDELIQELDEYIEEQKNVTKLPISKLNVEVKPLITTDEDYVKNYAFTKKTQLVRRVIELLLNKTYIPEEVTGLDFDTLARRIAFIDVSEIAKALLDTTYKKFKSTDIIAVRCPVCNTIHTTDDFNKMNINYADFTNISEEWDKDVAYDEYIEEYTPENFLVKIKHANDLYIKTTFGLGILSLHEYLKRQELIQKLREENNDITLLPQISNAEINERSLIDIFPVKRDSVFTFIKSIKLQLINVKTNEVIKEYEYTDRQKIYEVLQRTPLYVLDELRDKFAEKFNKYLPLYQTNVKCKHCQNEFPVALEPIANLIDRILF